MSTPSPGQPSFPPVTIDDWREEAERALRGRPLGTLTWRTEDGIELPPVAPDDDPTAPVVPVREGRVRVCTTVEDEDGIAVALAGGHDLVRIAYDHDEQAADLAHLDLESVLLDPIEAVTATAALRDLPGAAGIVLGWWGWMQPVEHATPAQQIGWIASAAVDVLTEADEEHAGRLFVEVPVGAELLTEIAKLRALRRVWADVATERDLPPALRILASGPSFPHTRLDAESNLLRATLAGFAAVTGGADVVELAPYRDDEEAARLALNQVRLMRDESFLDAVEDPFAGAGIVERLTAELARAGHAELDRLRAAGGYLAVERNWDDDRLQALIAPHEAPLVARAESITHRRRTVVGINGFADPGRDADSPGIGDVEEAFGAWTEPDTPLSELLADGVTEFEFLRRRMLWHEAAGNGRPAVALLPLGPVRDRRARADFAADLFRAGGFAIDDAGGLDSAEAAIEYARDAAVAVLCSDDASYPELAPAIAAGLPGTRVLVAGPPPDGADAWGVAGFVHRGVDAASVLCALQDDLGVGRRP